MFSFKEKDTKVEIECDDCGQTHELPKMMLKDLASEEEVL